MMPTDYSPVFFRPVYRPACAASSRCLSPAPLTFSAMGLSSQQKKIATLGALAAIIIVIIVILVHLNKTHHWWGKKSQVAVVRFAPSPVHLGPATPTNPHNRGLLV